jgi:hypothetical protein
MKPNLLILRCTDIERTMRFYSVLGMGFAKHAHGTGPEHYAHEDGQWVFELYPSVKDSPDSAGVGFAVANLDQARQSFIESGYSAGNIRATEWGTSFVIRDPDQRRVEIKQM